ncbi:hypothetical protein ACFWPQ_41130 [Streptomyces sp. NPDC058464]|uniref:hypothetical protein n=1 Tax=Streptomyces sp. NPDC058464 TaxID=3346511 RepID=UPI0036493719
MWSGRPPADVRLTRQVHADIARHPLRFTAPEILDAEEYEGVLVTYERRLPGASLRADSAQVDDDRPGRRPSASPRDPQQEHRGTPGSAAPSGCAGAGTRLMPQRAGVPGTYCPAHPPAHYLVRSVGLSSRASFCGLDVA